MKILLVYSIKLSICCDKSDIPKHTGGNMASIIRFQSPVKMISRLILIMLALAAGKMKVVE